MSGVCGLGRFDGVLVLILTGRFSFFGGILRGEGGIGIV